MNTKLVILFLLAISLLIETSLFAFPFVFMLSIILYILSQDVKIFTAVFLIGIILDVLTVSTIGLTPVLIFSSYLLLDLARRAFEIKDYRVIILFLFILSPVYSKIFSYSDNLLIYIVVFGFALIIFSYFYKKSLW